MKQASKRVPNRGSWKPGQSGNPNGRPRTGLAFAEATRERLDPHKVLDLVERHLADESIPIADRLAVVLPYVRAGYSQPSTGIDLAVSQSTTETAAYDDLPVEALRELEAAHRAVIERYASADPRLPEPSVTVDADARDTTSGTPEEPTP